MSAPFRILLATLLSFFLLSCKVEIDTSGTAEETAKADSTEETLKADEAEFTTGYEKYILDNGLEVILHTDHSERASRQAPGYPSGYG